MCPTVVIGTFLGERSEAENPVNHTKCDLAVARYTVSHALHASSHQAKGFTILTPLMDCPLLRYYCR
jgi:hypothetical protein